MVEIHRIRSFDTSHSLTMRDAVHCILVALLCVSRDKVSHWLLHICIKCLGYNMQTQVRPVGPAASANSRPNVRDLFLAKNVFRNTFQWTISKIYQRVDKRAAMLVCFEILEQISEDSPEDESVHLIRRIQEVFGQLMLVVRINLACMFWHSEEDADNCEVRFSSSYEALLPSYRNSQQKNTAWRTTAENVGVSGGLKRYICLQH